MNRDNAEKRRRQEGETPPPGEQRRGQRFRTSGGDPA